jgi:transcription elongation factor Elf1
MLLVTCRGCGHEGAYFIVELTDDYVTVQCPICEQQVGITTAQDQER